MRRLTHFVAGAGLLLAAGILATPAQGQVVGPAQPVPLCVTCSSGLDANGQPYCQISPDMQGWTNCSCTPYCSCSGVCITVVPREPAPGDVAIADPELLPAEGLELSAAPSQALLASLDHGRYFGETLNYAYFAQNYALLARPDGTWRMFKLEADGSVLTRDCGGAFTGRLYRSQPDQGRMALATAIAAL